MLSLGTVLAGALVGASIREENASTCPSRKLRHPERVLISDAEIVLMVSKRRGKKLFLASDECPPSVDVLDAGRGS
jgi:hypothetical protein